METHLKYNLQDILVYTIHWNVIEIWDDNANDFPSSKCNNILCEIKHVNISLEKTTMGNTYDIAKQFIGNSATTCFVIYLTMAHTWDILVCLVTFRGVQPHLHAVSPGRNFDPY